MLVLSLVDFLFFRVGTICGANRGAFQTAEETIKKPTLGRFVHFILFSLGLLTLSKPSVVMLPAVLALCIWWRNRRITWYNVLSLLPFAAISAIASVWTIWEQRFHTGATGPEWAQTWPERLIIAGHALWFYLAN